MQRGGLNARYGFVVSALAMIGALTLTGCGGGQSAPVAVAGAEVGDSYRSAMLPTSYEAALSAGDQLMLGTLKLEETGQAVTPEQAAKLVPLWRALQGLTAQVEIEAVLKQIEEAMTDEQLISIANMRLTHDDLQAWMEAGGGATMGGARPAWDGTLQPSPDGRERVFQMPADRGELAPEAATRFAEVASMTDEQREALRATMQAGGASAGGRGPGAAPDRMADRGVRAGSLTRPLIELLEGRAREAAD